MTEEFAQLAGGLLARGVVLGFAAGMILVLVASGLVALVRLFSRIVSKG